MLYVDLNELVIFFIKGTLKELVKNLCHLFLRKDYMLGVEFKKRPKKYLSIFSKVKKLFILMIAPLFVLPHLDHYQLKVNYFLFIY